MCGKGLRSASRRSRAYSVSDPKLRSIFELISHFDGNPTRRILVLFLQSRYHPALYFTPCSSRRVNIDSPSTAAKLEVKVLSSDIKTIEYQKEVPPCKKNRAMAKARTVVC